MADRELYDFDARSVVRSSPPAVANTASTSKSPNGRLGGRSLRVCRMKSLSRNHVRRSDLATLRRMVLPIAKPIRNQRPCVVPKEGRSAIQSMHNVICPSPRMTNCLLLLVGQPPGCGSITAGASAMASPGRPLSSRPPSRTRASATAAARSPRPRTSCRTVSVGGHCRRPIRAPALCAARATRLAVRPRRLRHRPCLAEAADTPDGDHPVPLDGPRRRPLGRAGGAEQVGRGTQTERNRASRIKRNARIAKENQARRSGVSQALLASRSLLREVRLRARNH
jgi:hypothetical protein